MADYGADIEPAAAGGPRVARPLGGWPLPGSKKLIGTIHLTSRKELDQYMPELARFFGIIVRMFAEAGGQHQRPHFHAYYQDHVIVYGIDTIEALAGSLPRRQQRLVEAWAELHQEELMECWSRLQEGRLPGKIEPLR